MARTTVSVDDELLQEARRALGTTGISDNGQRVNAALAAAVRQAGLAEFDVRLFDITDDELATARADRLIRSGDLPGPESK